MEKLLSPGMITGLLSFVGSVLALFGLKAGAVFISHPETAATLTTVLVGSGALIAGYLRGWNSPAPPK